MGTHQNVCSTTTATTSSTTTTTTAASTATTTTTTTIGKDQSNDDDMRKSPDEAYSFPPPLQTCRPRRASKKCASSCTGSARCSANDEPFFIGPIYTRKLPKCDCRSRATLDCVTLFSGSSRIKRPTEQTKNSAQFINDKRA